MFIKTFKTSKAELIILILGLVCFIATLWYIFTPKDNTRRTTANNMTSVTQFLVNAQTADDRRNFLAQFGWEILPDPVETRDIVIPGEFDETYTAYNDMLKPLGFDLEPYKGKSVKKWVYTVTNYPGIPDNVTATLLILDGEVIGGDITSKGSEKFTHSFQLSADRVPTPVSPSAITTG